jgi:hypothetical protein
MSGVHWHLLLNHIPVIGFPGAVLLLLGGLWRKSDELVNAALAGLVLVALLTIPTFLTGDPAEHAVRHMPGVTREVIHDHEESADASLTAIELAGAAALFALFSSRYFPTMRRWLVYLSLAAAVVGSALVAYTANLGGQIRHTEIRAGASPTAPPGTTGAETKGDD